MAPIAAGDGLNGEKKKTKSYKLKDLKKFGHQLLSSRAHVNNLPLLLTFVSPSSPPQHVLESVLSLQSFFTPLVPDLPPASVKGKAEPPKDPELIYRTWLRSKFDELIKSLVDIVASSEADDTLKEILFDTIMEFVKLGKGGSFQSGIYHRLIHGIVNSPGDIDTLVELLSSKYFKYIDVCYYTYISLAKLIQKVDSKDATAGDTGDADSNHSRKSRLEHSIRRVHLILSRVPPYGSKDSSSDLEMWSVSEADGKDTDDLSKADGKQIKGEKNANVFSADSITKKIKLKFTKTWLSFLRLPLPLDVYKEVLVSLHQAVIPYLSNPIMLCDFLTRSYDIGGVVSVMALSGLFILMTQHGLEYPNFYEKLYTLLQPTVFMAKHRAKFFELLDSCLKSTLLPAYLAAAFAKKLSRMALSVPPSGALMIVALIHNLLRKHPSINCLVHREGGDTASNEPEKVETAMPDVAIDDGALSRKPGFDHFRDEEVNPIKTKAMKSSLWEIDSLRHHYCPPVSRFVLSLENDLTVRAKTTEINVKDFSSGSYATIFGDETRRRVKQVPLAFYKATPTSLFSESDFPGWTFQCEEEEKSGNCIPENQSKQSAKRQRVNRAS